MHHQKSPPLTGAPPHVAVPVEPGDRPALLPSGELFPRVGATPPAP